MNSYHSNCIVWKTSWTYSKIPHIRNINIQRSPHTVIPILTYRNNQNYFPWICMPNTIICLFHFVRLTSEVLSLVPTVSEVTSLFSSSDYPPDFTKTLPPLSATSDNISCSQHQNLVNSKEGKFLNRNYGCAEAPDYRPRICIQ